MGQKTIPLIVRFWEGAKISKSSQNWRQFLAVSDASKNWDLLEFCVLLVPGMIRTSLLYHPWTCVAHPVSQRAWLPSQRYQNWSQVIQATRYALPISRIHLIGYLVEDGITSSVHAKHTFSRTSIMLRMWFIFRTEIGFIAHIGVITPLCDKNPS